MSKLPATARTLAGSSLVALAAAGSAHAAALEQTVPATIRLLYQEGRYIEFGVAYTDPDQSGEGAVLPPLPPFFPDGAVLDGNTGDVFESRWNFSGAYKADLNDRVSYALIFDQPLHADTKYGDGSFPHAAAPAAGLALRRQPGGREDLPDQRRARLRREPERQGLRRAAGAAARRRGGGLLRRRTTRSKADDKWGYGWLVGAAYERPEIALRVALTYQSKISYDLDTAETIIPFGTTTPITEDTEHRRRHPAVGAARLPDRRRAADPGLRLHPLGRLVGVLGGAPGLRRGDRSARSAARAR